MSLLRKYLQITKENIEKYGEKTIVYMQVGAFFEVYGLKKKGGEIYGSEIMEFSRIADLKAVPKKQCVGRNGVWMAGFHLHLIDKYVKKLNNEGYTIVVYRQDVNAPKSPRSLQGIYSPGTNFDIEQHKLTNNVMCIKLQLNKQTLINKNPHIICGISTINIITGKSYMFEYTKKFFHYPTTYDEIERFSCIYQPHELIIIYSGFNKEEIEDIIQYTKIQTKNIHFIYQEDKNNTLSKTAKICEEQTYQYSILNKFFNPPDIDFFYQNLRFAEFPYASQSFCFLLDFIYNHQPNLVRKISEPKIENIYNYLNLANHSLKQLNIINTNQNSGNFSSVLTFMNKCKTSMGRRKFKELLLKPSLDIVYLNQQYEITSYVKENYEKYEFLRQEFVGFRDIERLYRKIILNKVCPAELTQFYDNMKTICNIEKKLKNSDKINNYIKSYIPANLTTICNKLMKFIKEKIEIKKSETINKLEFDINIFKRGVFDDLDKIEEKYIDLFDQMQCIQHFLGLQIQCHEKKKTKLVKIHQTEKSGYNLDITKRRALLLKPKCKNIMEIKYISSYNKETKTYKLALEDLKFTNRSGNNMRIDSVQLTSIYNGLIIYKNKLCGELEFRYKNFIDSLSIFQNEMEKMVKYISLLDILITKAHISKKYNYCCPKIDDNEDKSFFKAKNLRHCLIEQLHQNEIYVPNDISLGTTLDGVLLYGTNAVGKSSLIRAIGIAIVLAQAGMHVPCSEFIYKPYKDIYTRILGNDDIFKGLSTFAVEMSELRTILNSSTKNSLVLGDELCSGTETDSAIGIFISGLTKLHDRECSFIFATHLHQITKMKRIKKLKKIKMKHMEVRYDVEKDLLIYNRKLKDGPGNSLYGLEVCKSLSMPKDFLELAYNIRNENNKVKKCRYNAKKIRGKCEICSGEGKDIHHMQFQQDANDDNFIEHVHKNHPANLMNICKECHDNITKKGIKYRRTKTSRGFQFVEIVESLR
jgi:DNA mismatch repair protein MutS